MIIDDCQNRFISDDNKKLLLILDEDFRKQVSINKDSAQGQEECLKKAKNYLRKHRAVKVVPL